ncbi:TLD-domain-containing protein [Serendipita vermifera]|nr:TLD-domain-containing protein [Serendipita vermifera]
MYDPFMDSFTESPALPPPLSPSRSATPLSAAKSSNDATISPPPASGTTNPGSIDAELATTFDPLASLSAKPRPSRPQTPRPAQAIPINQAIDSSTSTSTSSSAQLPSDAAQNNPESLADLFGAAHESNQHSAPARPAVTRKFSTTPLFQPLLPTHVYISGPGSTNVPPQPVKPQISRPPAHQREISDDFGSFVSVPVQSDPLSSTSSLPSVTSSTSAERSGDAALGLNTFATFTEEAQKRHSQNASRIMGELAKDPSSGGDFLGWLDKLEVNQVEEIFEEKLASRERATKSNVDEGPYSPPATPTEGPPPTTRKPPIKSSSQSSAPQDSQKNRSSSDISGQLGHDRPDAIQKTESTGGASSYFSSSLPRRFISLLPNAVPVAAEVSPPIHPGQSKEEVDNPNDPHAVFALPGSTSISRLASLPHMSPPVTSNQPKNVLPRTPSFPLPRAVPESFLTHSTPFSTNQYVPPSGAPGFVGDRQWDTGGFASEWDNGTGERSTKNARENVPRIIKLIGRKDMTAGVLTRGLGDSIRSHLPALARLCTTWTLLYSLDQHGISLQTFYHLSSPSASSINKISGGRKGALLVIRDALDGVFGAWIGEGLRTNLSGGGYFGGGDSFLWKAKSEIPDPSQETDKGPLPDVSVYKWTGRNEYVALCEPDFVSLGGGNDGKTGLYLASDLLEGSSARCMTFDNDILCAEETADGRGATHSTQPNGRTAKFEIIGLEVWGLVAH